MQHAACGANKAMVLCEEATAVRASPLLLPMWGSTWLQWVGSHPESNLHPLRGRRNCICPPGLPIHRTELCNISRQTLETLSMKIYASLWRICAGRSCFVSWMYPPEVLHQCHGGIQQVTGVLMRITRRSPFQKGEGGFLQNNHFDLLSLHNQMEDGLLRNHLLNPQLMLRLIQMRGTWLIL